MRIIFLGYLHGFGGAERAMTLAANGFADRHDVTVVSLVDIDAKYDLDSSVNNIKIDFKKGKFYILKELYRIFKEIDPHIVISFWLLPAIMSVLLKFLFNYKCIYAERGDPSDKEYNGVLGIIRTLSFFFVDGFVFQTKAAMNYFDARIRKRSIVIPNLVDIHGVEKTEYKSSIKRIVNVGRLSEQKNQALLIKAFSICVKQFENIELHIYGDGGIKQKLTDLTIDYAVSNKVFFHDSIPNIFEEMKKYDMFVLSSDYEGMPNALLEAMAIGLPCITTNYSIGGADEIIDNGVNGLIAKRGDLEDLSYKMKMFLSDSSLAENCGVSAKVKMKKFSKEENLRLWNNMIV